MRLKKPLSIGFVVMLLISMATIAIAHPWDTVVDDPQSAPALWVDPLMTNPGVGLNICDTFTVDVLCNITAGQPLFGFEYKLFWNSTILTATSIQYHGHVPMPPGLLIKNETGVWVGGVKDGLDYHWLGITAVAGQTAFSGVTSLASYDFHVEWQPEFPAAAMCDVLDIQDEEFVDDTGGLIPVTVTDGEYCLYNKVPDKPKIGVDPAFVMGVCAENFTLNVVVEPIKPLSASFDLCGWEVKLSYNTTVLDALECIEGAWFAGFAGVNGTYPICNINETAGVVHMANMYLGGHTQPFGAGVLMSIVFNATSQYTVPPGIPPHLYPMDLYDLLLVDCSSQPILYYGPNDGTYEEPYKILGWALDCWTDPYRKLGGSGNWYYTDTTGAGISSPGDDGEWDIIECDQGWGWTDDDIMYVADCYEPQEFVKLYAKLTYNEWPEQNKIVAFEIYGPCNPYWNISIIRTAITNATGIATINFTIPHPCENLEEIVFGKWICYQMAQVKDPWEPERYRKVVDILFWDVGWKVELLGAEATDAAVACGETAITIYYKNIALMDMHVCWTFSLFDTLLDPIGELVIPCEMVPAGEYCHPYYDNITVYMHIPKWAHVGPCAHVAVNAFTALPMQCGLPYCPEVLVHFTITLPP